jgi:hypothetical protein
LIKPRRNVRKDKLGVSFWCVGNRAGLHYSNRQSLGSVTCGLAQQLNSSSAIFAERRMGNCVQPCFGNGLFAPQANAKSTVLNALQRLLEQHDLLIGRLTKTFEHFIILYINRLIIQVCRFGLVEFVPDLLCARIQFFQSVIDDGRVTKRVWHFVLLPKVALTPIVVRAARLDENQSGRRRIGKLVTSTRITGNGPKVSKPYYAVMPSGGFHIDIFAIRRRERCDPADFLSPIQQRVAVEMRSRASTRQPCFVEVMKGTGFTCKPRSNR